MLTVFETVVVALVLLAAGALLGTGAALGALAVQHLAARSRRRTHAAQLARRRARALAAQTRLAFPLPPRTGRGYRTGRASVSTTTRPVRQPTPTLVFERVDRGADVGTPSRRALRALPPALPLTHPETRYSGGRL